MSQQPISRSPDLQRLRDDGYDIIIQASHLLVRDVPYVTPNREVKLGTLVSTLHLGGGDVTLPPDTHVAHFIGETPCRSTGSPLSQIINSSQRQALAEGLVIDHTFSSKPPAGRYQDYYEKMGTYVRILEHEAHAIEPTATARTHNVVTPAEDSVFRYEDTASTRANVTALTDKLRPETVGIIGLGGTGSYILDLIAKTPVAGIHLYDGDRFAQHNAFRAPGAARPDEMQGGPNKATYFQARYDAMHTKITAHPYYVTRENVHELAAMTFVFISIDRNTARKEIVEYLTGAGIPFIDVGMGIPRTDGALGGILRITTGVPGRYDHIPKCVSLADAETENEYDTNIQIADLNALNAALAVLRWKKYRGVYQDTRGEHDATYTISANMLCNNET
jgi:hypothetical protein